MVTKAQFDADPYQRREVVTPELDWLGDELCRRASRPRVAAGTKGDWKHLRGAHRSQDFILRSPLCTSRAYTRQDGLTSEQERHVAGFDFTPGEWATSANRALMKAQTGRLRAAMLDGRLAGVREVIGTLDGKTVSGTRYNGERLGSDDSHLDHWHLTFDRRRCRDKALMERVIAVALGDEGDDDMFCAYGDSGEKVRVLQYRLLNCGFRAQLGTVDGSYGDKTAAALSAAMQSLGVSDDGRRYGSAQVMRMDIIVARHYGGGQPGPAGPQGPAGPAGPKGDVTATVGQVVAEIGRRLAQD